ncbi:MAG TPA: hypothetical protein VLT58_18705 [Polyangia bacterium]|nr:hypothetical protein [Polyangia bacterium]
MFAGQLQRVDHGQALEPPPLHGALAQRLGRIRGRLKALTAVDGAVTGAALATTAAALLVGWCRWRASAPSPGALAAIVAAGAAAGAVARAWRRISWTACARLVDQVLDGEDRVLSAVWLAGASSPLARAAVADAVARTERLDPRVAVPGRRAHAGIGHAAPRRARSVPLLLVGVHRCSHSTAGFAILSSAKLQPLRRRRTRPAITEIRTHLDHAGFNRTAFSHTDFNCIGSVTLSSITLRSPALCAFTLATPQRACPPRPVYAAACGQSS